MPARPHRTVDRVIGILETVSLNPRGVTLAELAKALNAAKSSVQELTNGLLAHGYLTEDDRRFHLGPGPFILAFARQQTGRGVIGPPVRRRVEQGPRMQRPRRRPGRRRHRLHRLRGSGVTGPHVRRPHPRPPSPLHERGWQDLARQRPRRGDAPPPRPCRARAGRRGAAVPRRAPRDPPRRLAFNRGATFADAYVVATPLLAPDGTFIAAISAAVDPAAADRLDQLGEELKDAVATVAPRYVASGAATTEKARPRTSVAASESPQDS